jgi:RimJ/RimL family protein N-acetyltransferase
MTQFQPVVLASRRLLLHELSPAQAHALLAGEQPVAGYRWAAGYPLTATRVAAAMLIDAAAVDSWRPGFGVYQIVEDQAVLGDIGFHGAPNADPGGDVVEVGYGLVPAARGRGLATEALAALTRWALNQPGVSAVSAETTRANLASQRVLVRAGFHRLHEDAGARYYQTGTTGPDPAGAN